MCGLDLKQNELFSYRALEQRIPNDRTPHPQSGLVDTALPSMDRDIGELDAALGLPPKRLLRTSLLSG